jgi:hypothetical protein
MSKTIDIETLVENSPLTKFSENVDYKSKIIEKLKKTFTDEDQQLFLTSFYCYLNFKPNEFVIDLKNVWKWLGFGRIEECKRLLTKDFTENTDYVMTKQMKKTNEVFRREAENLKQEKSNEIVNKGGRPIEDYILTIKCFKKLCIKPIKQSIVT